MFRVGTTLLILHSLCLAAAAQDEVRLLYAQETEDGCEIGVWDASAASPSEIIRTVACPEYLFTSDSGRTAYMTDGDEFHVIPIAEPEAATAVPSPNRSYQEWASRSDVVMHPTSVGMLSSTEMDPVGIGRLADGSIAMHLQLIGPADDTINYLVKFSDAAWALVESKACDRWEFPCLFETLSFASSDAWLWPENRMIWHDQIKENPYYVDEERELIDLAYESYNAADVDRRFRIDGRQSTLAYATSPSEHSDTVHTFGIELLIDGKHVRNLSEEQCLTSLMDRYLLVQRFFGGGLALTDLGTGETMLGDLKAAMWLD